jgi:hypothetical protein
MKQCIVIFLLLELPLNLFAQRIATARIFNIQGQVDYSADSGKTWQAATNNQPLFPGEMIKAHPRSSALVQNATVEGQPDGPLDLREFDRYVVTNQMHFRARGAFRLISRGIKDLLGWPWDTTLVSGGVRRTDFTVVVTREGDTLVLVTEGEVETVLKSTSERFLIRHSEGKRFFADGRPATNLSLSEFQAVAQTYLYYPGIAHLEELKLPAAIQTTLKKSIDAYRDGDLPKALAQYPSQREPTDVAEKLFLASLVLVAGDFQKAESLLGDIRSDDIDSTQKRIADAIRQTIAAVQAKEWIRAHAPMDATEWLAESYYQQSRIGRSHRPEAWEADVYGDYGTGLERALVAAKNATPRGSTFDFAWVRRAELEFSFGRIAAAEEALANAARHLEGNAQAIALKGFLHWARYNYEAALAYFKKAAALDGTLGDGWLGIGLTELRKENAIEYFRRGKIRDLWRARPEASGLHHLEMAVTAEPERSLLRSYLGKAYYDSAGLWGESSQKLKKEAFEQLELAKRLDPADPTPHLYSALLKEQENRINEAISELDRSVEKNDNRRPFRSRLLLDQDQAVRSANLARIYDRAGMKEVSVREAARSVVHDPANHSAHAFLSQSFNALRDPTRFNLRHEAVWLNELLLANLLAPVGAGILAQNVTHQEYSRLFEADGLGLRSDTEIRSDGQFRQVATHHGNIGKTGYSIEVDYQHNDGVRPNNDLSRLDWYTQIKQQLTFKDSLLFFTKYLDYDSGDNFQYFDPEREYQPHFRLQESQAPVAMVGYHREWSPGIHTLALVGRLESDLRQRNLTRELTLFKDPAGRINDFDSSSTFALDYERQLEAYTAELNQIFQRDGNTAVLGGRFQSGDLQTKSRITAPPFGEVSSNFEDPIEGRIENSFERFTAYGYYTRELIDGLYIIGGLSYDTVLAPENFENPPLLEGAIRREQLSPKAAIVWSMTTNVTVRGAYTRSLGGITFESSYRLEPTQLAGFSQSFRTIMPALVAGSVSQPEFETAGAALDIKLPTRTYIGLDAELLRSNVERSVGVFDFVPQNALFAPLAVPSSTRNELDYEERAIALSVSQLLDEDWSLALGYRFARSDFSDRFPLVPLSRYADVATTKHADLHRLSFSALFNHHSGFFSSLELLSFWQNSSGYVPGSPELIAESFQQINFYFGYRFPKQKGEVLVGALNLSDQDYRLNPLSTYAELPRERVWMARLRLNF